MAAPETPASAFARQLARIRAARPVLLAGAPLSALPFRVLTVLTLHTPPLGIAAGVATLLDDGRGDGTAAGFVHTLRDWAGAFA